MQVETAIHPGMDGVIRQNQGEGTHFSGPDKGTHDQIIGIERFRNTEKQLIIQQLPQGLKALAKGQHPVSALPAAPPKSEG